MKSICVLVFLMCGLLVVIAKPMTKEEKLAMFKPMIDACQKETSASDNDVGDMIKKQPPVTSEAKCLHACMMEKIGVIKNGAFSPEGAIELTKMSTDNNEKFVNIAMEIADECKSVSNADKCDLAINIMQCVMDGATKRGIDIKEMQC